MKIVTVDPDKIPAFGEADGSIFCLLTNTVYLENFSIAPSRKYVDCRIIAFDDGDIFENLLTEDASRPDGIPPNAHILTILPDRLFFSLDRSILGRRQLLIMACRSGKTDLDGIEHFLRAGEVTDPASLEEFAGTFFAKGEQAEVLRLVDRRYGTEAIFNHMQDCLEWHEQFGFMRWGDQQVYPSGEIACFVVPLKIDKLQPQVTFEINGRMALRGQAIVQSGPPSFLLEDQNRIWQRLSTLRDHAVLIDIENGDVVHHEASHPDCQPAADMLQALFEVDSRFRRIYEIGFAINTFFKPWVGNTAMNEVHGGSNGLIHLGLGMLPHSQYHLDVNCEGTLVLGRDEEVIFGSANDAAPKMRRQRAAACPCMTY